MARPSYRHLLLPALLSLWVRLPGPALGQGAGGDNAGAAKQKVTVNADGADLRAVLKTLFNSAHAEYVLDPEVQGKITVSLTDIPFRIALETVLKSAEVSAPLTYNVEDGIYRIMLKPEPPAVRDAAHDGDGRAAERRVTARIDLRNADAETIASIVGGLAIAPDCLIYSGDTSAFGGGFGGGQAGRWVHTYQRPDGASYVNSWSLGGGSFGGPSTGSGGGIHLGGSGRGGLGALGGLGGLGRLLR